MHMHMKTDVLYTQAGNCQLCIQIGSTAFYFGKRKGVGRRLELFTPRRLFRWSWGKAK